MLFVGLLIPVLLGNTLLWFFDKKHELLPLENLALSFLLGQASLTLLLFWAFWLNLPHKVFLISLLALFLFAGKLLRWDRPQIKSVKLDFRPDLIWLIIFLPLVYKIIFVLVEACSKPEYSWDACLNWTKVGRHLFWASQLPNFQLMDNIGNNYPKMISLMHFWLFSFMGSAQDQWSKLFFPISLICLLVIFYYSLKKQKSGLAALGFTYVLASCPFLLYHATIGYADLLIAVYFSLGIIFFYRWISDNRPPDFWLFCLFISFSTWVKLEGKLYLILGAVLLLIFWWKRQGREIKKLVLQGGQYLGAFAVIGLPWQIFVLINHMGSREQFGNYLPFFSELMRSIYLKLFLEGSWGIFWIAFIGAGLLFWRPLFSPKNIYLLLSFILFFGAVLFVFLFTADGYDWFNVSFNRIWLSIYPVAVFTLAQIARRY